MWQTNPLVNSKPSGGSRVDTNAFTQTDFSLFCMVSKRGKCTGDTYTRTPTNSCIYRVLYSDQKRLYFNNVLSAWGCYFISKSKIWLSCVSSYTGPVIFFLFQMCRGNIKAAVEKTFPFPNISDLSCQKSQISSTMSLKSQPQSSITSVEAGEPEHTEETDSSKCSLLNRHQIDEEVNILQNH